MQIKIAFHKTENLYHLVGVDPITNSIIFDFGSFKTPKRVIISTNYIIETTEVSFS